MSAPLSLPHPRPAPRACRAVRRRVAGQAIAALAALALCLVIAALGALSNEARASLIVFVLAIAAWTATRLPETGVALAAGIALVLAGAIEADDLFEGLGDDVVWLLIGAFALAAVVRATGLAERLVLRAVAGSGSVHALFHRLALLVGATAFVVPSTSGRAAMLLPVFAALAATLREARVVRALALLFPTVILLSACASLLGAGAHLVALEALDELDLPEPGFLQWALLGTPVAALTCVVATELILRLFLDRDARRAAPALPPPDPQPATPAQARVLAVVAAVVALWASGPWHGIDPALIAVAGALVAASRAVGGVALKDAIKGVEWNLVLFLAVTLVLGEALLESGAAQALAALALEALPRALLAYPLPVTAIAALLAMASHLVITSRTARAAVLIPTLALPLALTPQHAAPLIVLVTVASGFCQTLRVSAKPVALYHAHDGRELYSDADLLRLSLWLMPAFAAVLVACALWLWPLLGLGA